MQREVTALKEQLLVPTATTSLKSALDSNALGNDDVRLLTLNQFLKLACISRSYYYVLLAQARAPRPIKLGDGRRAGIRIVASEAEQWIANLISIRDSDLQSSKVSS